ncbi:hypothetical protein A3Q56_04782 [Intoshia linei]|uniref:RUN domain-containing protein n=1 Tax=Intoshia linei TaxID=1819745 RepID=A0A177AZM8_9BILA|nr:hypothetical protein A3Q56_04782 [Intoshia linei]
MSEISDYVKEYEIQQDMNKTKIEKSKNNVDKEGWVLVGPKKQKRSYQNKSTSEIAAKKQKKSIVIFYHDPVQNDTSSKTSKSKIPYNIKHKNVNPGKNDHHSNLIHDLKRSVKLLLEEYVNRKQVYIDSASVNSLCVCLDSCLLNEIRLKNRWMYGYVDSSEFLIERASVMKMPECEDTMKYIKEQLCKSQTNILKKQTSCDSENFSKNRKITWMKIALMKKTLNKIVGYISNNMSQYYSKESFMIDTYNGNLVSSLLEGINIIEFTKFPFINKVTYDSPASDLMQRYRLQMSGSNKSYTPKYTPIPKLKHYSTNSFGLTSMDKCTESVRRDSLSNYIESLHQSNNSVILYGKNHINIRSTNGEFVPGYLSLHSNNDEILLKWTSNALMKLTTDDSIYSSLDKNSEKVINKTIIIRMKDINFLHIHKIAENKSYNMVLVDCDGIQNERFNFPGGTHLLNFLSRLEFGFLPSYCLSPPILPSTPRSIFSKLINKTDVCVAEQLKNPDESENEIIIVGIISNTIHESLNSRFSFLPFMKRNKTSLKYDSMLDNDTDDNDANKSIVKEIDIMKPLNEESKNKNLSFSLLEKLNIFRNPQNKECPDESMDFSKSGNEEDSQIVLEESCINNSKIRKNWISHSKGMKKINSSIGYSSTNNSCNISRNSEFTNYSNQSQSIDIDSNCSRGACNNLYDTIKYSIVRRAFRGWFTLVANKKRLNDIFPNLILKKHCLYSHNIPYSFPLDEKIWSELRCDKSMNGYLKMMRHVYKYGCNSIIRHKVWPYIFGHYAWVQSQDEITETNKKLSEKYNNTKCKFMKWDEIIKKTDMEESEYYRRECRKKQNLEKSDSTDKNFQIDFSKIVPTELNSDQDTQDDKILYQNVSTNIHRIDKDVARCDRNHPYFNNTNLNKLRNIMGV